MKAFQFPLERVLAWRETQQAMAEARLEILLAEQRTALQRRHDLQWGRIVAQGAVARAAETRGTELADLESLRAWTNHEDRRVAARLRELDTAIQDQRKVVATASRNVKMLERLRTRRHSDWQAAMEREFESQAGEWAITQWRRAQPVVNLATMADE